MPYLRLLLGYAISFLIKMARLIFYIFMFEILSHSIYPHYLGDLKDTKNANSFRYKIRSMGTFTASPLSFDGKTLVKPERHSYFWTYATGDYRFLPGYHISTQVAIENRTFSSSLKTKPYTFNIFPLLYYSGSLANFFSPYQENKGPLFELETGVLPNFTTGSGLLFRNFPSLGIQGTMDWDFFTIKIGGIGSGYSSNDDVFFSDILILQRVLGIGGIVECNGEIGDRILPHAYSSRHLFKFWKFYTEGALAFDVICGSGSSQQVVTFQNAYKKTPTNLGSRSSFLMGVSWKQNKFLFFKNIHTGLEFRYYGERFSDFYLFQKKTVFNYQPFLSDDEDFNNQPFIFMLYPGESIGGYHYIRLKLNIWQKLWCDISNEFLLVRSRSASRTRYATYGFDIYGLSLYWNIDQIVLFGARVSNKRISFMSVTESAVADSLSRTAMPVEPIDRAILLEWFVKIILTSDARNNESRISDKNK
ncbi:MAG: hypothetical protein D6767_05650 [Candidatus Hydrogenedentota bacterium]|nr:MAG: hypothetical protein D6767_05650 [Candidatus Hydrogenedentota bacterium]